MPLYEVYATKADLAEYLFVEAEDLVSEDYDRLLLRASELVKQKTLNNINPINNSHLEALKLATCAQVEYWQEAGEYTAIIGSASSFTIGDLGMSGMNAGGPNALCARALEYLNQQGLLYCGLTTRREVQKL